ncbi:MAG: hypothetical protein EOO51_07465 [Flavobacterium sp.]|nr:MAG: hypothetical protein EOO51_07465 [Flavobacterium sp.]
MKNTILLLIFLCLSAASHGQRQHLVISGSDAGETKAIDSLGYARVHANAKSVADEAAAFTQKLKKNGYFSAELTSSQKVSDTTFNYTFALGKKIKNIHIYIGSDKVRNLAFPRINSDTLTIAPNQVESLLNDALQVLERKGYSLATLNLENFKQRRNDLYTELHLETGKLRQVNDIVINGYDKFPEGHKKNIRRLYKGKTFTQDNLKKIYDDFAKFRFVTQTKYPEILFTKDTTKVYVYLEKAKANRFDGFLGFSNDQEEGKSKLQLNGYLDLLLVNALNTGEEFTILWKSDGKQQKSFHAGVDLPYVFRSPFGLKANLEIFKQDSTYQNTKTAIEVGYFFNYNTRVYLGYQATESSDIQNTNTALISDYKNKFLTGTFTFKRFRHDDFLFPEESLLTLRAGVGSRVSKLGKDGQAFGEISAMQNLYLNEKNIVNLKSQNYYLQSGHYIISELYRFGGINSIRGFNENSLQASLLTSLLSEYRYVFAPGLYVHSIIDYAYFRDESRVASTGNSGSLLGLGFGFGFLTKNGLFNLVYANGTPDGQQIKLSNSIVHVSFKANF